MMGAPGRAYAVLAVGLAVMVGLPGTFAAPAGHRGAHASRPGKGLTVVNASLDFEEDTPEYTGNWVLRNRAQDLARQGETLLTDEEAIDEGMWNDGHHTRVPKWWEQGTGNGAMYNKNTLKKMRNKFSDLKLSEYCGGKSGKEWVVVRATELLVYRFEHVEASQVDVLVPYSDSYPCYESDPSSCDGKYPNDDDRVVKVKKGTYGVIEKDRHYMKAVNEDLRESRDLEVRWFGGAFPYQSGKRKKKSIGHPWATDDKYAKPGDPTKKPPKSKDRSYFIHACERWSRTNRHYMCPEDSGQGKWACYSTDAKLNGEDIGLGWSELPDTDWQYDNLIFLVKPKQWKPACRVERTY